MIARTVGAGCPGDFYDVLRLADGQLCVFAGCIKRADGVEAAVEATAARTVIAKELATRPPEEALAAAVELFRPSRLSAAHWDPRTGEGQRIDCCGPASSCGVASQPLPEGRTTLLHSFEPQEGEVLERHHTLFRGLPVNELAQVLERSLDTALCGQLIAIGASESVSATRSA